MYLRVAVAMEEAESELSPGAEASREVGRVPHKVTVREWLRELVMVMAFPSLIL